MKSEFLAAQLAQEQTTSPTFSNNSNMASSLTAGGGKLVGSFNLARQTSIYSLTLDEFQNALGEPGKNFGSMNMDEFLKNIWTAEESQAIAAVMMPGGEGGTGIPRQQSLQRQGSLTLPRTLSRKTVDEVWKDIHRGSASDATNTGGSNSGGGQQPRQMTMGEMTLEDFLVKAGVVREDGGPPCGPLGPAGLNFSGRGVADERSERGNAGLAATLTLTPANGVQMEQMPMETYGNGNAQHAEWMNNQYGSAAVSVMAQQQQHLFQQHAEAAAAAAYMNAAKNMGNGTPVGGAGMNGLGGSLGPALVGSGLGIGLGAGMGMTGLGLGPGTPPSPVSDGLHSQGNGFGLSPVGNYALEGGFRGRKRGLDGQLEVVVERRQRRMIKNRESAARSRARKQAYTVELEAEVNQLKEENMRLRKQQEDADKKRKQMLDMISMRSQPALPKMKALRRTRTGPW